MRVKSLSRVRLLATPWTAAHQAPPSMGFSRQEYWSGVPLPSPKYGNRGIKKKKKKDLKVFALINWNDRENYRRSEFCNINQELPAKHVDFVMPTTD